jgi:hypothetical protein
MATSDGGPAFPLPFVFDASRGVNGQYIDGEDAGVCTGLTLRDYFAGQVLASVAEQACRAYTTTDRMSNWIATACDAGGYDSTIEAVAEWSYAIADAMLVARAAK